MFECECLELRGEEGEALGCVEFSEKDGIAGEEAEALDGAEVEVGRGDFGEPLHQESVLHEELKDGSVELGVGGVRGKLIGVGVGLSKGLEKILFLLDVRELEATPGAVKRADQVA